MPAPVVVDPGGAVALLGTPLGQPAVPRPGRWAGRLPAGRLPGRLTADGLPLALLSALSAGATLAAPLLLDQPLLLVALTPRIPFLLLAAPSTPLPVFLLVAGLRLCVADVYWFRLGRRLGPAALARLPRLGRRLTAAPPRWRQGGLAVLVLIRPIGRHLCLSGALGASPWSIGVIDVVGTLVFLGALHVGITDLMG